MYEVHVTDDFMVDGLAIYLAQKVSPDTRSILHFSGDFSQSWDKVSPETVTEPTMRIPGELARALLETLLRFYEGASDMHTARQDLLHERGRVDKLTAAMVEIATGNASQRLVPAPDKQSPSEDRLPHQLIARYVNSAVRRATTEPTGDGRWYAEVSILPGVWAEGGTEDEALAQLAKVVKGWVLLKIEDRDRDIPVLDTVDLNRL